LPRVLLLGFVFSGCFAVLFGGGLPRPVPTGELVKRCFKHVMGGVGQNDAVIDGRGIGDWDFAFHWIFGCTQAKVPFVSINQVNHSSMCENS